MSRPSAESPTAPPENGEPGPPAFRTWRGVYGFVLGSFVLQVVLLAVFTWIYS